MPSAGVPEPGRVEPLLGAEPERGHPESPYLAFIVGLHVATALAVIVYFCGTGFGSSGLLRLARPPGGARAGG